MSNFFNYLDNCFIGCTNPLEMYYWTLLEQILVTMYNYLKLPKGLEKKYIEQTLIRYGCCGIVKLQDGYFVGIPAIQPPLNNYGIGTKIVVTTWNGEEQVMGTIGIDCVLIWNNSEFTGDYIISWFAKMFKEIDISMEANIYNARLHPIPIAKDSKIKSAIDNIFKSIKGETKTTTYSVLSETAFAEVVSGNSKTIDVLNLTDVSNIDKLQYLTKFYDDLLRRFCTIYGQPLQTSGKMAQQTIEEIQGYDSFSRIVPSNRLEEREKGIVEFNKIFNENVVVEFNDAWKTAFKEGGAK